jgi:WD repeat-containing protein 40A
LQRSNCIKSPLRSHPNSRNHRLQSQNCGIHSITINPSRSLLATGSENVNDIAIYSLPSLEPLCVGYDAHSNCIFDSVWIDDTHVVSGAGDSKLALWSIGDDNDGDNDKINQDLNENFITNCSSSSNSDTNSSNTNIDNDDFDNEDESYLTNKRRRIDINGKYQATNKYNYKTPTKVVTCKKGKRIRALTFNKKNNEIAAIAMNASFHSFNSHRFVQVRKIC